MLVINTILMMCLKLNGYNLQYPKTLQDLDAKTNRCLDRVASCYYNPKGKPKGVKGDLAQCLEATTQREVVSEYQ